jgi:hypothetical protein
MNARTTDRDNDLKGIRTLSWLYQKNIIYDGGAVTQGFGEPSKESNNSKETIAERVREQRNGWSNF